MSFKDKWSALVNWLMQPVFKVKRASRRWVVEAIRSRSFFLAAILSSLPVVIPALGGTYKAAHTQPSEDFKGISLIFLLWLSALLAWVFFLLTLYERYRRLRNKKRNLD